MLIARHGITPDGFANKPDNNGSPDDALLRKDLLQ
jgi:hypothetical protein